MFHYTTAAGLIGIVSTATIWATASEYLNDPQEWKYGADLVRGVLSRLSSEFNGSVLAALERLEGSLKSPSLGMGWYVTCFCSKGDLLPQWRSYADKGGGYCIELDRSEVQQWADQHGASLFRVDYLPTTQADLIEQHLRCAISKLQEDLSTNTDPEERWQAAAEVQLRIVVLPLILRFKHPAFKNEEESRLCYFMGSAGIEDEHQRLKYRPGRGFVVPYLPLPFTNESMEHPEEGLAANEGTLPIVSIRCGPTTHPSLGRSGVEALMVRYGYDVPVEVSEVPYRD